MPYGEKRNRRFRPVAWLLLTHLNLGVHQARFSLFSVSSNHVYRIPHGTCSLVFRRTLGEVVFLYVAITSVIVASCTDVTGLRGSRSSTMYSLSIRVPTKLRTDDLVSWHKSPYNRLTVSYVICHMSSMPHLNKKKLNQLAEPTDVWVKGRTQPRFFCLVRAFHSKNREFTKQMRCEAS